MLDAVRQLQARTAGALLAAVLTTSAMTETIADWNIDDVVALMERALIQGQTGTARKTKLVDARPAHIGEIIVTAIKGEGKETQSPPAKKGDWVVRNRCPETGNEQYLVTADRFNDRYRMTGSPVSAHGWREYRPIERAVRFHILPPGTAPFTFVAPWGEPMVARAGDALVQDPKNEKDVYRVAALSFACTYEIVGSPSPPSS
jgi:hypothetical protein